MYSFSHIFAIILTHPPIYWRALTHVTHRVLRLIGSDGCCESYTVNRNEETTFQPTPSQMTTKKAKTMALRKSSSESTEDPISHGGVGKGVSECDRSDDANLTGKGKKGTNSATGSKTKASFAPAAAAAGETTAKKIKIEITGETGNQEEEEQEEREEEEEEDDAWVVESSGLEHMARLTRTGTTTLQH